jgi:hypothetical protein
LQATPEAHFGHVDPPQSGPLSVPFLTPSVQVAGAHAPPWQLDVEQSAPPWQ